MFNDNYCITISEPVIHFDKRYNDIPCAIPSRTVDKEMYELLLKSFDSNDTEEEIQDIQSP